MRTKAGQARSTIQLPGAAALPLLLFTGMAWSTSPTLPVVEFLFNQGTGNTTPNSGTAGGNGTIASQGPAWSTQAPVNGGSNSVDFGTTTSGNKAVDLVTPNDLKNLKSFTITGWLNAKSASVGGDGNRIVTWTNWGGDGVDLAFQSDGSLSLGVNEWNLQGCARSSGGKITVDANSKFNNWRFFAVTYNGTVSTNNVKFYFGSNGALPDLDVTITYARGNAGPNFAPNMAIGHLNSDTRPGNTVQMFRGLIDQVCIYGSTIDGSGAKTPQDLATIQNAAPITGRGGLMYDAWDNITGSVLEDLVSAPDYPSNPSATMVRSSFDGPQNRADNFGARMTGWVQAPQTGNYFFWIASDDQSELRLSTDANPVNKRLIASVANYVSYQAWNATPAQKSAAIALTAGQYYYIEALMKEVGGADHLSVGWQLPSGTLEQPIPAGRLFLTPSETDELFPSTLNLYEQGTSTKKATLGWKKETGNNHFFLETEGESKLTVRNDVVNLPKNKLFFGENGEQNDLGFRYDRPAQFGPSTLFLETDMGNWALKINGGGGVPYPPYAEFNQRFWMSGPNFTGWESGARLEYESGLIFSRFKESGGGVTEEENSALNGTALTLTSTFSDAEGTETGTTHIHAGSAQFSSNLVGESGTTSIVGGIVSAQEVHTTKWKVQVPDYVFEKGYAMRSLGEVERFVREHKHLPDIPSAQEMEEKGMGLGEMNLRLLKTVEELTLHVIELDKELKRQKSLHGASAGKAHGVKSHGKGQ